MMNLTTRQQHVLDTLINYQRKHGFPPTNTELAELLGCSSPNAAVDHLRTLEKKGVITITRGVSRGICINTYNDDAETLALIKALVTDEADARERAITFLQGKGITL
ncbi:LexA family transcriptional regulator [Salmonella enterica subsp. enterica serovar Vinohrady]|uniref:LexA family protein n=1 Tax=Salmonella enterica TaxID=28901 RepID=UPI0009AF70F0|nr:Rrf2 family transcriptional regulator [Salmonella enterica]EDT2950038.1 LexA family transcriptional regulator [Salmonella enterica subsp. enterica serovar Vinohrady]